MNHFGTLPICKQQVLFHFHFHINVLDADGLRDFIILHSKYNLVEEGMQSKERYFVPPNQSIEDIPNDIQHLYLCGFNEYDQEQLVFSNNSFNQLKSIQIKSNQIKSNQIKSYFPISHIPYNSELNYNFPEFE